MNHAILLNVGAFNDVIYKRGGVVVVSDVGCIHFIV